MPLVLLVTRSVFVLLPKAYEAYSHVLLQCVRAFVHEQRVFVAMVLILIFAEVLGLYGCVISCVHSPPVTEYTDTSNDRLIVALIMNASTSGLAGVC